MSLFLNALKTLADRPPEGFPAIGADPAQEESQATSAETATTTSSPIEYDPQVEYSPSPCPPERSTKHPLDVMEQLQKVREEATASQPASPPILAQDSTEQDEPEAKQSETGDVEETKPDKTLTASKGGWTGLWKEALQNPTPVEVTPDEPDSPEEVALSDLAEIAKTTQSPSMDHVLEQMARSKQVEETKQEESVSPAECEEVSEPEAKVEESESGNSEPLEDAAYTEEMKFIFAPWFEAHAKPAESEEVSSSSEIDTGLSETPEEISAEDDSQTASEDAPLESTSIADVEEQETASEIESEAAKEAEEFEESHAEAELELLEESADDVVDESLLEEVSDAEEEALTEEASAIEEGSQVEEASEPISAQDAAEDLLTADSETVETQEETWALYDRTADKWSESRSVPAQSFPNPENTKQAAEESVQEEEFDQQQTEPQPAATVSAETPVEQAKSEAPIPSSPIAAALATFAAEMKRQPASPEMEAGAAQHKEESQVSETPQVAQKASQESSRPRTLNQQAVEIKVTEPYLRLATRICQTLGPRRPQGLALAAVDKASCQALNLPQLARALTLVEEGDVLVIQGSESRPDLATELGILPTKRPRWARVGGGDLADRILCNADGRLAMLSYESLGSSPIQLVDPLLLARCKRHYSLILVETGDLTAEVSQNLIAQADVGLVSAVLHHTPRETAAQSASLIRKLGVRISGCVLCEARPAA